MRIITLVAVIALFLVATAAIAQQEWQPSELCDMFLPSIAPQLELSAVTMSDAVEAKDITTAITEMRLLRGSLANVEAYCNGYVFKGTGNEVIGPVYFEMGTYIARLEADELAEVDTQPADARADACMTFYLVARENEPDSAAVETSWCDMLFEVDTRGEWQLTFEQVRE